MRPLPWRLEAADPAAVEALCRELEISKTVATILVARGHESPLAARAFLAPRLSQLTIPTEMVDLDRAAHRLADAIADDEVIGVFGDYDVDGVTSTALLGDYLERSGARLELRVARRDEGYGFSPAQAQEMLDRGCALLILTDCGTSDLEALRLLADAGVPAIVVDHHRLESVEDWPGFALVNPQRPDCRFPFKGLCSGGLAFYLAAALRRLLIARGREAPDPRESLDLVALATVADVAPMEGDNRVLVAAGLQQLWRTKRPGLRQLLRFAEIAGRAPTTEDIGWRLGPRLNAPGRMGDADVALRCLYERDEARAREAAERCHSINEARKEMQRRIYQEALDQAEQRSDDPFCLVAGEGWHAGVVGIVASKLAERFERPAAVVALNQGEGRASARSVAGVDLYDLLRQSAEHLLRYGGHTAAAGFSVAEGAIAALREALNAATAPALAKLERPALSVSAVVPLSAIDDGLLAEVATLEPFGPKNPAPRFGAAGLRVETVRQVGQDHLAMRLRQGTAQKQAIAFGLWSRAPQVGQEIDLAFFVEVDTYGGVRRLRLRVEDLAPAGEGILEHQP